VKPGSSTHSLSQGWQHGAIEIPLTEQECQAALQVLGPCQTDTSQSAYQVKLEFGCYHQVLDKIVVAKGLLDPFAFSLLSRQTFHKLSDSNKCMQMTLGTREGLAHLLNGALSSQSLSNKALGFSCLLHFL
jgi:hypothetical protein